MQQAASVMDTVGQSLAERGWAVVVPVSPDGRSFFGDAGDQVLAVMETFSRDPDLRTQRVLLAGVSNGGIAALQVASMEPDRVSGVIAVPGMLHNRVVLRRLKHVPVYLRVGAEDHLGWAEHYDDMVRKLTRANVRLDAQLLAGVDHGIPLDWEEIDAWIARELGALAPTPPPETRITLPAEAGQVRTWTSRSGETVRAALTEIRADEVTLTRVDRRRLRIRRQHLSEEDQAFLRTLTDAADGRTRAEP
jgi:predicted esterase